MRAAGILRTITLISLFLPALAGCGVKGPPVTPDGGAWGPASSIILAPSKSAVSAARPAERIDTPGNPLLECAFFFQGV